MSQAGTGVVARQSRIGGRVAAVWRFARHYGEMVIAMVVGMVVLDVATGLLGKPPGYDEPLGLYAYMAFAMSAPMVAWMRGRMGHPWSDCWEMTASMVVPMFALVVPVALGLVTMEHMALMMWSHVAMLGGMLALMLYRWDTYAHGAHCHRPANTGAVTAVDPVCGMAVDPATARWTASHAGATYAFCAPACRTAFERQPSQFLAPDYRPSM